MVGLEEDNLRQQILIFLKDFKELMGQGHYYVKEHLKNIHSLRDLGLTTRLRDEIILSVSLQDYSSGPHLDMLKPGDYWVFGKVLDGVEIYIKLKIVTYNDGNDRAICISFHPSEHPLKYPFRPAK